MVKVSQKETIFKVSFEQCYMRSGDRYQLAGLAKAVDLFSKDREALISWAFIVSSGSGCKHTNFPLTEKGQNPPDANRDSGP
jgi:hypothetical protein